MFVRKLSSLWCVNYQDLYEEFISDVSKQILFCDTCEKDCCSNFIGCGTFISLDNVHHMKKEKYNTMHQAFKKLGSDGFVHSSK